MFTVAIIEDLAPARKRFEAVISAHPKLQLIGVAETKEGGVQLVCSQEPDVVLLDLGLPDGSGIEVLHAIREHGLASQALVISIYGDEQTVVPALEAGAAGYLMKDQPIEDLPKAVLQMMSGGAPISPAIARHMLRRFQADAPPASQHTQPANAPQIDRSSQSAPTPIEELSKKEREVLELVSRGFTSQEIAEQKGKSYHTITTHVRNIYRKLAVNSRAEAVSTAMKNGWLPEDCP